ncbi:hypothetical protein HMPREF3034_02592, partial [Prevotella sp. DNF00663]
MVKDRVKAFCKAQNISVAAFEKSIDVANGYVNSISKSIGVDKICDILEKYSMLNIEWLLTGKGNMYKEHSLIPTNDSTGIPLITVEAMAGFFAGSQTVMLSECERFLVPSFRNADFLIAVRGDSMQPHYFSGDLVACKMLSLADIFFQWGKVYV